MSEASPRATLPRTAQLVGVVGVTGLVMGAVGGWVGLVRGEGPGAVAAAAAPLFWGLAVLSPAGLALGLAEEEDERAGSSSTLVRALRAASAGAAGGMLAALFFLVTASQIPAVFGDENAAELIVILRERIFWRDAAILSALTAVAGLVTALSRNEPGAIDSR